MDFNFFEKLASSEPAPGGGTASAYAGCMGAALLAMVAKLSQKNSSEAEQISKKAEAVMRIFFILAEEDEKAFLDVMKAYKLPKSSDEEKKIRAAEIEKALKKAVEIPFQTSSSALETLKDAQAFLAKANKNAVSDLGVSVLLARAAAEGGLFNVLINLSSIKEQQFVKTFSEKSKKLLEETEQIATNTLESIRQGFNSI
jgi:formiminotetrahydrofolate cyclodeaminase